MVNYSQNAQASWYSYFINIFRQTVKFDKVDPDSLTEAVCVRLPQTQFVFIYYYFFKLISFTYVQQIVKLA